MADPTRSVVASLAKLAVQGAAADGPLSREFDTDAEAVLLERLTDGTLELRPPWALDATLETLCLLVRGAAAGYGAGVHGDGTQALRTFLAAAVAAGPAAHPGRVPTPDGLLDWHATLRAQVENDEPLSPAGIQARFELTAAAPLSAVVMWTARRHVRPLLEEPRLQATEEGRRLWLAAAQLFAAEDGNRILAEQAVDAMERDTHRASLPDPVAQCRGIALLLRLERFEEADTLLWRAETAASAHPVTATQHAGLQATMHWMTGELELAAGCAARATGGGAGHVYCAATGARALIELGRLDAARAMLDELGPPVTPLDIGSAMQLLALAELDLAEDRASAALGHLTTHLVGIRLTGHRNPSGWRWVEPTVRGLVACGEHERAREIVHRATEDAERWGTPLVLAELAEARAIAGLETYEDRVHQPPVPAPAGRTAVGAATAAVVAGLSPRVAEVAELVADGLRDREIAERLTLSPRTVNRHVAAALKGLGLRNRTELAALVRGRATAA